MYGRCYQTGWTRYLISRHERTDFIPACDMIASRHERTCDILMNIIRRHLRISWPGAPIWPPLYMCIVLACLTKVMVAFYSSDVAYLVLTIILHSTPVEQQTGWKLWQQLWQLYYWYWMVVHTRVCIKLQLMRALMSMTLATYYYVHPLSSAKSKLVVEFDCQG